MGETATKEIMESITERRSWRKYTGEQVSKEDLEKIIKCMQNAPTGVDFQSYDFYVVTNKEKLAEIAKLTFDSLPEQFKFHVPSPDFIFYGAPAVIFIQGTRKYREDCYRFDIGTILTSGAVAAESLGLGSCIVGLVSAVDPNSVKPILGSASSEPLYALLVGNKDPSFVPADKPINHRVSVNN